MCRPLVLCHPETASHDDDRLGHVLGQSSMETHGAAELLGQIAHFRTTQQDVERSPRTLTFSGKQMIDHDLLLARHFVVFEGPETIAYQNQTLWIGSLVDGRWVGRCLGAGDFDEADYEGRENLKTHRGPPSDYLSYVTPITSRAHVAVRSPVESRAPHRPWATAATPVCVIFPLGKARLSPGVKS